MTWRRPRFPLAALPAVLFAATACCEVDVFDWWCPPNPIAAESECWSHDTTRTRLASCGDDVEPNDIAPMARELAPPGCTAAAVAGAIGGDDVDMFHTRGDRCDSMSPRLELGTKGVRACLFVQCSTGSTGSTGAKDPTLCSDGSTAKRLPNGMLGCCLDKPNQVDLDVACSTTKKGLDAYVVVDGSEDACTPYDVKFHL